ncbi:GNAT family N-acetyltransferase [Serratia plymuthica]|nr:GNAT family N-acetyltransferase [Serratia plymuthica]
MSSDFLENYAQKELLSYWNSVLSKYSDDVAVFVAEKEGKVEGFICVKLQNDAQWGAYIDSLHISSALRGQGAGKKLLRHAAEWINGMDAVSAIYLWVFEDNVRATIFYQNVGGVIVERTVSDLPSADKAPIFRVSWKNASQLIMGTLGA